jgi:aldose 1-epimerase
MSASPSDVVTLRSGDAGLAVAPSLGGAILSYWTENADGRRDWLTPRGSTPVAGFETTGVASFPLVPYSNRIRDGRFRFGGRDVAELLRAGSGFAIHGHGRGVPWRVVEARADFLAIAYTYEKGPWPWPYRARQEFALAADGLTIAITVENLSREDMPAGLGHHPYFPRTPQSRITAAVAEIWQAEAGAFPTTRAAPPPDMDPRRGIIAEAVALDHAFAGWDGRAVIEWPEHDDRLLLTAGPDLSTLIIYTPPGKDFFCVEPVSHCVDAFNLAAAGVNGTGMGVLRPGEAWSASITLAPRRGHD